MCTDFHIRIHTLGRTIPSKETGIASDKKLNVSNKKITKCQVSATMNETFQERRLSDLKVNLILDGLITSKITHDI